MAWLESNGTKQLPQGPHRKINKEGIPVFLADIKEIYLTSQSRAMDTKLEERYKLLGSQSVEPQLSLFDCGCLWPSWVILFGRLSEEWGHCFSRLLDLKAQSEFLQLPLEKWLKRKIDLWLIWRTKNLLKEVYEHSSVILPNMVVSPNNLSQSSKGLGSWRRRISFSETLDLKWLRATRCIRGVVYQYSFKALSFTKIVLNLFNLDGVISSFLKHFRGWGSRKAKVVFFFDEAHLLFKDASKLFLEKVEQVVHSVLRV